MGRADKVAKSALDNFCAAALMELATACADDAKDQSVGPVLAPFALQGFFRALSNHMSGATPTATVDQLAGELTPLLREIARQGIQDSDRFNRTIDTHLRSLRHLIP